MVFVWYCIKLYHFCRLQACSKKESAAVANLPTQRRFWLDNLVIKSNRDNKDSDKKKTTTTTTNTNPMKDEDPDTTKDRDPTPRTGSNKKRGYHSDKGRGIQTKHLAFQ